MVITIIAARNKDNLIGVNGKIPWHSSQDLAFFKETTMNHAVIMGRLTFESLPKQPLPGRFNIVLSVRHSSTFVQSGAVWLKNHKDALSLCEAAGYQEVFIIGGEAVYKAAMDYADRIILTTVYEEGPNVGKDKRYFPVIDYNKWQAESLTQGLDYHRKVYIRKPANE